MKVITESIAKTQSLLRERDAQTSLPLYFRAPVHGHDPIFSLTRPKLYQLANDGLIRSVSLREKYQKRATRLFDTASVAAYIAACAARAEAGEPAADTAATEGRAEA